MRRSSSILLTVAVTVLSAQHEALAMNLKLDFAGGSCNDETSLDDSFEGGLIQGAEEIVDMTTTTSASTTGTEHKMFGFSVFRGASDEAFYDQGSSATAQQRRPDFNPFNRRLQKMDCPVYQDCPGAGNPFHWCAWICGYWAPGEPSQENPIKKVIGGNGFFRRVMEDMNILDSELDEVLEPIEPQAMEPITYSQHDRDLRISIESFVCRWIQRWLDSPFSKCLNGATLDVCVLDLRSN